MPPGGWGLLLIAPILGLAGACVPAAIERADEQPRLSYPLGVPDPAPPTQILPVDPPVPVWEARPVTADAQDVPTSDYVVQPGDGLRSIALATGAGSEAIARANGLVPPFLIRVGQHLVIPGGRYHLVRVGESGIAIARAYGVRWTDVIAANQLAEPYILRVGQRILIPRATPQSAAERAAAFHLDLDDIVTGGEPASAEGSRPMPATQSPSKPLSPDVPIAAPIASPRSFSWPVEGPVLQRFGPGGTGVKLHGIKIGTPKGTPVHAAAEGTVAYTGTAVPGLGGLVMIRHGGNWTSVYAHTSQILVQRGQAVKRGQTIALSGATGNAPRPELHFELRKGRTPVDPLTELPQR